MPKCCATDCENEGVHRFPKLPTQRELWEKALRIPDFKAQKLSSLCTDHFKEDDYFGGISSLYDYYAPIRKILKRTAVPSLFNYNHNMKSSDPGVNLETRSVAVAQDSSNLNTEIPFLRIVNVTSLKNELHHNAGCDIMDIKSEINDEIEIDENIIKVKTEAICRTCLTENATIPLTENCDDGCTLGAMLKIIADVRIEEGFPNVICFTCVEDLRFAIAFRRRARLADKTLHQKSFYSTSFDDDTFTEAKDILSNFKVEHEPPPCDLFETILPDTYSTFDSEEMVKDFKKESDYAASVDHCETDINEPEVVDRPVESGHTIFNRSSQNNTQALMTQETNKKPTLLTNNNRQVLKLKAIDQTQVPLELKMKVEAVANMTSKNQSSKISGESYLTELKPKKMVNVKPVKKSQRKKLVDRRLWKCCSSEQSNKSQSTDFNSEIIMHQLYTCPNKTCKLSFASNKLLLHHKITSHPTDNRLCAFNALNHLKLDNHVNRNSKKFLCKLCGCVLYYESHLSRHMRQTHPTEKLYQCTYCDKRFYSKNAIKYHGKHACHPTEENADDAAAVDET